MRFTPAVLVAALLVTGAALAPATPAAAAPPGPVFTGGEAQPVFDPADVVRDEVWVRVPVDSDRNGVDDEVRVEVVRPRASAEGLRVPVVYQASPYYAGGNDVVNHDVDVELHVPDRPGRGGQPSTLDARRDVALGDTTDTRAPGFITTRYEPYFLARGFAMVYAESLGSGGSTGCPTSGGENETLGAKAVVDWLNGRAVARNADGSRATAGWTTGSTAMMGVSYNGTLPNAVASTGVEGLDAIVPIAAISSWYDYYRADGAVVAPGGYQGEDTDVLAEYVLTRQNADVCRPVIDELVAEQDRVTGDYSPFWAERDYLRAAQGVRAATIVAHGLNDENVRPLHAAQWYAALPPSTPHKIWWHQSGHTDVYGLRQAEWLRELNRWFTRYLHDVPNGVEREPKATLQREDGSWVTEADWPAPGTADVRFSLGAGGSDAGTLGTAPSGGGQVTESLTDDAQLLPQDLAAAPSSPNRLRYDTAPAAAPVRLSGTVRADLRLAVQAEAANVTAMLVDRAPDGRVFIITRGWTDPQNRASIDRTQPIRPGQQYRLGVELQPDDYLLPAGHQLGLVLLSSDYEHTLRPGPGTQLDLNVTGTRLVVPVVGGTQAARAAFGR